MSWKWTPVSSSSATWENYFPEASLSSDSMESRSHARGPESDPASRSVFIAQTISCPDTHTRGWSWLYRPRRYIERWMGVGHEKRRIVSFTNIIPQESICPSIPGGIGSKEWQSIHKDTQTHKQSKNMGNLDMLYRNDMTSEAYVCKYRAVKLPWFHVPVPHFLYSFPGLWLLAKDVTEEEAMDGKRCKWLSPLPQSLSLRPPCPHPFLPPSLPCKYSFM